MSELGPDARSIVDAGRDADDPTAADRARVRGALTRALAAPAAGAPLPPRAGGDLATAAAKTAASPALKILAALAVIGAVGAALTLGRSRPAEAPPAAPAPSAAAAEPPPAREPAPPREAPASSAQAPAALAPASAAPLPADAPSALARPAAPREASVAPAPSATPSAAPAVAPPPGEDPLAVEIRRLREVHGALKDGDPNRALALLDENSAASAQGELREERAAARVLALCKLGRTAEATSEAARFLRESPRSPLADRVRASCATSRAP